MVKVELEENLERVQTVEEMVRVEKNREVVVDLVVEMVLL